MPGAKMEILRRRNRPAVVAFLIVMFLATCCNANQQQEQDIVASMAHTETAPPQREQAISETNTSAFVNGDTAGEKREEEVGGGSEVENEDDYVSIYREASDNSQSALDATMTTEDGYSATLEIGSSSESNQTPLGTSVPGPVIDTSSGQVASGSGPDAETDRGQETPGATPVNVTSSGEHTSDCIPPASEACTSKASPVTETNSGQYDFEASAATTSEKGTEGGESSELPVDESEALAQDDESNIVSNLGDTRAHSTLATGDSESARNEVDAGSNLRQEDLNSTPCVSTAKPYAGSMTSSDPFTQGQAISLAQDLSSKQAQASERDEVSPVPFKSTLKQEYDPEYIDLDEIATEESQEQPTTLQPSSPTGSNRRQHPSQVAKEETVGHSIGSAIGNTKVSPSRQDGSNYGTALASEVGENFKECSLASFVENGMNEKKDLSGQTGDDTVPKKVPKLPSSPTPSEVDSLHDVIGKMRYSWTWGVATGNKRYADLAILGMLFDEHLVANASTVYKKVLEPVDDLVIPAFYSKIMLGDKNAGEETENSDPNLRLGIERLTDQRSVNTEFVEGLDDLDKFFEGVDPPDELDVGAAGTSIQDVLMGQTFKIIVKRIARGTQFTSTIFKAAKTRVAEYFANGERRIPKIKKKHFLHMKGWFCARGKDTYLFSKELLESIFRDDDEMEGDEFMDYASDLQKRLAEMTTAKGQPPPPQ